MHQAIEKASAPAELELWNVSDGRVTLASSQPIVNILGRLAHPASVARVMYSLNGGPERAVCFRYGTNRPVRLAREGDFNIDTIRREELRSENDLELAVVLKDGTERRRHWRFRAAAAQEPPGDFRLDLSGVGHAHEAGQVVEGRWRVGGIPGGPRWLEVVEEDAGLDRVILFGGDRRRSGYTVRTRLHVTRWMGDPHSVGIVFSWNPHRPGDGTSLPSEWSTGLAYYYSHCRGLRVRLGVDVRRSERGEKLGDHILKEEILSPWRFVAGRACRRLLRIPALFPQVTPGRDHIFELRVDDDRYAFTVWRAGRPRPAPRIVVEDPPRLLDSGAVGVLAHRCAVRVHDFQVISHRDDRRRRT